MSQLPWDHAKSSPRCVADELPISLNSVESNRDHILIVEFGSTSDFQVNKFSRWSGLWDSKKDKSPSLSCPFANSLVK